MEQHITSCKFLVVFTCLFVLEAKMVNGSSKGTDIVIWSGQKYINSRGLLFVKIGSSLELNCTSLSKSVSIVWNLNGLPVKSIQLQDATIQYRVDKVTWGFNGSVFWCGPSAAVYDGVNATVIVGDLPSPPRNPFVTIHDVISHNIKIRWKHALYTGHIPADYKVTYRTACYNNTLEHQFCHRPHTDGSDEYYRCNMLLDDMVVQLSEEIRTSYLCNKYCITIVTVNNIGFSTAVSVTVNAGYVGEAPIPTPLPPSQLHAVAKGNFITVSWISRDYQNMYDPKYILLYHAEGEKANRTKEVRKQRRMSLGDDIKWFTRYYIYLLIEVTSGNQSQTSETIGPVNVTTPEGKPKGGPTITGVHSIVYSSNATIRDITLKWQEPAISSWQGKPSNITLLYKNEKQSSLSRMTRLVEQDIPTNATLTRLNSMDYYSVYTILCNTKHCGGIGEKALVRPVSDVLQNQKTVSIDQDEYVLAWISGTVIALALLGSIAVYKWCRVKRSINKLIPHGQQLEQIVPSSHLNPNTSYDYAENPNPPSQYTEVRSVLFQGRI